MKTFLYIFFAILFVFTAWQFYTSYSNKNYETLPNVILGTIDSIDFKIYDEYIKASRVYTQIIPTVLNQQLEFQSI